MGGGGGNVGTDHSDSYRRMWNDWRIDNSLIIVESAFDWRRFFRSAVYREADADRFENNHTAAAAAARTRTSAWHSSDSRLLKCCAVPATLYRFVAECLPAQLLNNLSRQTMQRGTVCAVNGARSPDRRTERKFNIRFSFNVKASPVCITLSCPMCFSLRIQNDVRFIRSISSTLVNLTDLSASFVLAAWL